MSLWQRFLKWWHLDYQQEMENFLALAREVAPEVKWEPKGWKRQGPLVFLSLEASLTSGITITQGWDVSLGSANRQMAQQIADDLRATIDCFHQSVREACESL